MKQHIHDRRYLRLKYYNYSQEGAYFVTICINDRKEYFEKYPELQSVVLTHWNGLKVKYPMIELDEFVVMPNHVHGIVFIVGRNDVRNAGATRELPLQIPPLQIPDQRRQNMLLSEVVGYFKMNTAKQINKILNRTNQPFWQRSYYEHVIRNETELNRIRGYIINNPLKWGLDRENPESRNFDLDHDSYWKEIYFRDNS